MEHKSLYFILFILNGTKCIKNTMTLVENVLIVVHERPIDGEK